MHLVSFRIISHISATIDLSSQYCKAFRPSRSQQPESDPVVAKNTVRKLLRRASTNPSSSHGCLYINGRYSFQVSITVKQISSTYDRYRLSCMYWCVDWCTHISIISRALWSFNLSTLRTFLSYCSGDAELSSVDRNFTEIVVVRHGETEWNAEKRIQVLSNF